MAVDLHLHSRFSDGSEEPSHIVLAAADLGLTCIALTDHDNLEGVGEARRAASRVNIDLIPGTELSVDWPGGAMHLLVYFLEPGSGPLQDELGAIRRGREQRNVEMVERLNKLGLTITHDEVAQEAGAGVMGRPHFAAVLLRRGEVDSIPEAFERYLGSGKPAYVPRARLEVGRAIELAHRSGAVTAVAHPHTLGVSADDYGKAFSDLRDLGLDGIEAHYAEYTPSIREHLAGIAKNLGMVSTGGSDFHGSYKPGLEIGVGYGDLTVPDTAVEELRSIHNRLS